MQVEYSLGIDDFYFYQSTTAETLQHEHESLMLTSNAALREPFF